MIKDRSTEIPSEERRGLLSVFHFGLPFLIVGLMLFGSAGNGSAKANRMKRVS